MTEIPGSSHLFPNHIFAPFIPNPHFVHLPSWNIDSCAGSERLFLDFAIMQSCILFGISDRKRAPANQMCCKASMTMRRVVSTATLVSKLVVEGGESVTHLGSDQV